MSYTALIFSIQTGILYESYCFRNVENFETILVNLLADENFETLSIMEENIDLLATTVRNMEIPFSKNHYANVLCTLQVMAEQAATTGLSFRLNGTCI